MNKQTVQLSSAAIVAATAIMAVTLLITEAVVANSVEKNGYDFPNAGIATVLNPSAFEIETSEANSKGDELNIYEKFTVEHKRMETELAMANVSYTLNVRADASEDSDKVGYLYRDCGGTILEQRDGWTKIQSGALTGWCSDEFLLFGDEAEKLAEEVGKWTICSSSEALRVRTEPKDDAEIKTIMSSSDIADYIDIVDDNWLCVDFEGEEGYISTEFVNVSFYIDEGETMEQVDTRLAIEAQLRKAAEEAAKKAAAEEAAKKAKEQLKPTNTGSVSASADELRLLAALIYCEAGNQSHEGKVAVGAVVMNRVKSPAYPNTIYAVIYASGQFTPARSGKVARVYDSGPPESCYQAAAAALSGESPVGSATHFRTNNGHPGIVIGAHVFW